MDDAIALLTNENRRLNTIINALVEKLQATEDLLYTYKKEEVSINKENDAMPKIKIGASKEIDDMLENRIGVQKDINAMLLNKASTTIDTNATLLNNTSMPKRTHDTFRNKVGISTINIPMLMNELKTVMNTCPDTSLMNTAKLLIHLYDYPKNSISDFRKVCSLSADGMAKNVRAMNRRHLITKVSFQRYTLTEMTLKMLERSATVNS